MTLPSRAEIRITGLLMLLSFAMGTFPQTPAQTAILARDVDRRPLPKVAVAQLSPGMRRKVQALIDEAKGPETPEGKNRATPPALNTAIYRIPVAPKGHRLYYIQQDGEPTCAPNGPNCTIAVYDETDAGIDEVVLDSGLSIDVVRRPNLQMPDIAAYVQEGHFATDVTVYRFDGSIWKPFLCKSIEPINDDPNPAIVADKSCKP